MKIYIRKLYSFLIVFIAAISLFPAACSSGGGDDGDDPPVDNPIKGEMTAATAAKIFTYTVDPGGVTISLFKDVSALQLYLDGEETLVLNTIGGRPVSVIAAGAFNNTSGGAEALFGAGVTSVRLPETLTDIKADSFTGAGIAILIVPASVVSVIGSQVFDELETNSGVEIVEVPSGAITIATPEDMAKIGVHAAYPPNGEYLLTADITLENWMPIGAAVKQPFTGTFDGNGKTITLKGFNPDAENITIMIDNKGDFISITFLGIFWWSDGAVIRDFNLVLNLGTEDSPLDWSSCPADWLIVGGVVGNANQTEIRNIILSGKLIANRPTDDELLIGGIAGGGEDGTVISGCASSLKIEATAAAGEVSAGGIAELLHDANSRIENCHTTGDVSAEGTKVSVGGLVRDFTGTIKNCFTTGNIRATATTGRAEAGGLVSYAAGDNDSATTISIKNSYATGAIRAETTNGGARAGGIVGRVNCGNGRTITIKNCYATGDVSSIVTGTPSDSSAAGGLIGQVRRDYDSGGSPSVTIKNCYATGNVSGDTNYIAAGGIIADYGGEITTYATRNCAALNQAITGSSSGIGRVVGSFSGTSILSDNIASVDMTLNDGPVSSGDTHDGPNGVSQTTEQLETESTWTSLFSGSFGTSDSAPWVWDGAAKRPKLYWQ